MGWQKRSGYNWRALVEADVARWKRVIGDALRSQKDGRQATEIAIATSVLNRMLELDARSTFGWRNPLIRVGLVASALSTHATQ